MVTAAATSAASKGRLRGALAGIVVLHHLTRSSNAALVKHAIPLSQRPLLLASIGGGSLSSSFSSSSSSAASVGRSTTTTGRRKVLQLASASSSSFLGGLFSSPASSRAGLPSQPTNEVTRMVDGMKHRRLGGSDVCVSELGLGTQRWVSDDFNAPNKELCYQFLDRAVLEGGGVNLLDTAEQYPIPSGSGSATEGDTELLIGQWLKDRAVSRDKVVIATKITGGRNVTPKNIAEDCEGSLRRLQTDYVDVYQLHWPQRYSPQSNWGQSLMYHRENDANPYWRGNGGPTSFHDLCASMQKLIDQGKIRAWGLCNDNAYGLTACSATARALGTTPPCSVQGDFSLIDRKSEENGVAEASSPYNENVGFMSYNALAGGMLTGKYLDVPAALDDLLSDAPGGPKRGESNLRRPRGRMDTRGWGGTLFRYRTRAAQDAIQQYANIAKRNGMPLAELALRWCRQRDLVTTTLVGHTSMEQLEQSLAYMKMEKPLSNDIMWDIDMVHMKNRLPIFSSDRVGRDWNGRGEIGETIP